MRSKIISLALGVLIIIGAGIFLAVKDVAQNNRLDLRNTGAEKIQKAKIGNGIFNLRIADTELLRERGLSGTESLDADEGMLFRFPNDGLQSIWMKEMKFPIDIIWLSSDFFVIDLLQNVLPSSFPEIFSPKSPARFVVELPAGSTAAFGINTGSKTEFLSE